MHCPDCNHKLGFFKSLLIVNPFRIRCPACSATLTMGRFGALFLAAGFSLGFMMASVAIYMNEQNSWGTPEIVLWFLVAFPAILGAYEWLGWRYTRLAVRKHARRSA